MPQKRYRPGEIIGKLRQADVLLGEGKNVLWVLAGLFLEYGIPEHIRSDNGPEFVAVAVRDWLADLGIPPRHSRCASRNRRHG